MRMKNKINSEQEKGQNIDSLQSETTQNEALTKTVIRLKVTK